MIQINPDDGGWVSDSPYLRSFDCLDRVHHQMEEDRLSEMMEGIGYTGIKKKSYPLPNGKSFIQLDYQKMRIH